MHQNNWDYSISSVVGSSHVDRGQGKQDNSHLIKDNNGNISFCISDGAGSSKNSELSSKIVTNFINQEFLKIPDLISSKGAGPWINDFIIQVVVNLRSELFETFKNYDLRDYHCTLVAGLVFGNTAIVVHVGDGFILAGKNEETVDKNVLNKKLYFSKPENGEYKNETYFVTEPIWLKHLRIQVLPDIDWLIAGSDGGEDILSIGEKLQDIEIFKLLDDTSKHSLEYANNDYIDTFLSSDKSNKLTTDDKSLCLLISKNIDKQKNLVWDSEEKLISDFYPKPKPVQNPIPRTSLSRPQINTYQKPLSSTKEYTDPNEFINKYGTFTVLLIVIKNIFNGLLVKIGFYSENILNLIIKYRVYALLISILISILIIIKLLSFPPDKPMLNLDQEDLIEDAISKDIAEKADGEGNAVDAEGESVTGDAEGEGGAEKADGEDNAVDAEGESVTGDAEGEGGAEKADGEDNAVDAEGESEAGDAEGEGGAEKADGEGNAGDAEGESEAGDADVESNAGD